MNIAGLQKMTLLDFPGHIACTAFTAGCNFRCPFCHNASLVIGQTPEQMEEEEFFSFLSKRRGLLDGVAVTGGEPLLQKEIAPFLRRVHECGFAVKLDTNGSFPDRLAHILEGGLADYVAMDIKNSPQSYGDTCGVPVDLDAVRESVSLLMQDRVPYEFRTTLVRQLHTIEDMTAIGEWIRGARAYFLQKFVDSGDLIDQGFSALSDTEMNRYADAVRRFVPAVALRGVG